MTEEKLNDFTNYFKWRSISWGAIFAGLAVTFAVYFTINLLGAGIGIATIGGEETSGKALSIGAGIWWFLSGIISLYVGGWVAGTLSGAVLRMYRVLHGAAVWALMYLVSVFLLTTALAGVVGGTASILGQTFKSAGSAMQSPGMQQALQLFGVEPGNLKQEVKDAVGAPQMTDENVTAIAGGVQKYLQSPRSPQDRQQLTQIVSTNSGKPPQEVDSMIQRWEQQYEQTKQTAKDTGEKAATISGTTAIVLSIVMLLGLLVASLGAGMACGPSCTKHDHAREWEERPAVRRLAVK